MSDPRMRVDVVTGPVRYRVAPLLILLATAVSGAIALGALVVWSDRHADAYEASSGAGVPTAPATTRSMSPLLVTPLISARRAPGETARQAAGIRLASAMDQLYTYVGEGSCVSVAVDGRVVSTRFAADPVIPASVHKLLVAAVALDVLGADYRFTTTLHAVAADDGIVQGNVYLVGGGDPLLTSDDFPVDDAEAVLHATSFDLLADALVNAGVTGINGAVVGDGGRYDDEWSIPSWGAGVAGVEAGPYDALFVNDARVRGRSGRERDPNLAAAREFVRLLGARQIWVGGGYRAEPMADSVPVLATVQSAPLEEIIEELLVYSDNDTAEMLLKELGYVSSGEGTVAAGLQVVDTTLRNWGLPMDGVHLVDASGLSASNRVTCALVVALLDQVAATPIVDALAVAGRSGTLANELIGSPVEGAMRAKTGTLGNPPAGTPPPSVKALAGYLDAPNGAVITFAMILNGDGINEPDAYRTYWEALAQRLAEFPASIDTSLLGPR